MTNNLNKRIFNILKKPNTWFLTLLYIVLGIFLDNNPDEMLLYLLPEGIFMMLIGMGYEMVVSKSVSKAIARFFIYLLLIGLTVFLLMFPFSFTIFFNSAVFPDLNLFNSDNAETIYIYMSENDSFLGLALNLSDAFKNTIWFIVVGVLINFLPKKIKEGSIFIGAGHVPLELKYVSFMTIGFVIGMLPAFIIGFIIPGSFPFVLIIVMRFYTELMMESKMSK